MVGEVDTPDSMVDLPRVLTVSAAILACILSLLGILGNLLTIVSLSRMRRLRIQATTAFVISLAVSDLLFCSVCLPLTAVRYFNQAWTLGPILCKLYPFFFYGNYAASLINMVAIAINRYILIAHFSIYRKIYTRSIILIMILSVWMFSFGWLLPPLFSVWGTLAEDPRTFTCTIRKDSNGRSPKTFLFILGFSLPCLAITMCYSAIFYTVRTSRLAVASSGTPLTASKSREVIKAQRREDLQLTKTMVTIFVVFLVTFLPAMLANVFESSITLPWLHLVASLLSWTSGAVNPLVYSLLNRQYKKAFRQTLWCDAVCGSSVSLAATASEGSIHSFRPRHGVELHSLRSLSALAAVHHCNITTYSASNRPKRRPAVLTESTGDFSIVQENSVDSARVEYCGTLQHLEPDSCVVQGLHLQVQSHKKTCVEGHNCNCKAREQVLHSKVRNCDVEDLDVVQDSEKDRTVEGHTDCVVKHGENCTLPSSVKNSLIQKSGDLPLKQEKNNGNMIQGGQNCTMIQDSVDYTMDHDSEDCNTMLDNKNCKIIQDNEDCTIIEDSESCNTIQDDENH